MSSNTLLRQARPALRALRAGRPATSIRVFHQSAALARARPSLPFLEVPALPKLHVRYITTTDRPNWFQQQARLAIRVVSYALGLMFCYYVGKFAVYQEIYERQHPTPPEWSFWSRLTMRTGMDELDLPDRTTRDWGRMFTWLIKAINRAEDPNIDGAGVVNLNPQDDDLPLYLGQYDIRPKDVTAMSEVWRAGYFEALYEAARNLEHVEDWKLHPDRHIIYPPDMILGPSNPNPSPLPPGRKGGLPKESEVEPAFPQARQFYEKIIATKGFNAQQRLQAQLAYANYLEFKQDIEAAGAMYEQSIVLAAGDQVPPQRLEDPRAWIQSWVQGREHVQSSQNLLTTLTSFATFLARHDKVAQALPILISILKARRELPSPPPSLKDEVVQQSQTSTQKAISIVKDIFVPRPYPLPTSDGFTVPKRDAKELCEEASLHLHIGEIIYATRDTAREEGLAWTREGVDMAEEQLHGLMAKATDEIIKQQEAIHNMCRECLAMGLENWAAMVSRLAREEKRKQEAAQAGSSWFGLWGDGQSTGGRWEAEEKVVADRRKRSEEILEALHQRKRTTSAINSMLQA